MKSTTRPAQPGPPRFIYWLSALIMLGVGGYYAFMAIDGTGLDEQIGEAIVIEKEYRPAGETYSTQIINGRTHRVPQATAEAFILTLDVEGSTAQVPVERTQYQALAAGDQVQVRYIQRRLTGRIQATEVIR